MKLNRKAVHEKYNGHCAYCGVAIDIKEMQVDHLLPQWRVNDKSYHIPFEQVHCEDNYMPSCRSCNKYKSGNPLESFRRDRPTFNLAERFGLIECKPKPVVFYFENTNQQQYENQIAT